MRGGKPEIAWELQLQAGKIVTCERVGVERVRLNRKMKNGG